MFCIGELAMLVLGIFTLVNGAFRLSRERVVWGVPARVIGGLLLLPLFVFFGAFMTTVVVCAVQNREPNEDDARRFEIIVLGIDVAILMLILGLALTTAESVDTEKSSKDGGYEGDDVPRSED